MISSIANLVYELPHELPNDLKLSSFTGFLYFVLNTLPCIIGMVINNSENLKDHIIELNRKIAAINGEIIRVGVKHQVRKKKLELSLKYMRLV